MSDVVRALLRALLSQLHPRMLWLAIWPFLVALLGWGGLAWWYREDILQALGAFIGQLTLIGWVDSLLLSIGIGGFKVFLVPLTFIGLLVPLIVLTALLIVGLAAMPVVIDHVARRSYPDLARAVGNQAFGNFWLSVLNSVWVTLVFVLGWLATMPLWLIAPLALVLPLLWWAWLATRILRLDSLLEHASAEERATLIARHRRAYLMLGLTVSLMNFVPPLFFFAPVYSGLAFTHFSLHALGKLRAERAPVPGNDLRDMGSVEIIGDVPALPGRPESTHITLRSPQ